MRINQHWRYFRSWFFHYVGLGGTQPIRQYRVFLLSMSLWRWVCVCVCAYLLHWTLDLGPDTCQACAVPLNHISISQLFVWCVFVGKYHGICWRSKLWVSRIKLKLPILGKPLWLLSHCSSNSPSLKKKMLYCLTKLLRLTLNLQLCFLSCLSNWDYRSCHQAWFSSVSL